MLTFGVDERRTEPSVEDPGDGDGRALVGVMFDAEPNVDTEGPAACSEFRPVGDLIDCWASRRGRPALPQELVENVIQPITCFIMGGPCSFMTVDYIYMYIMYGHHI